MKCAIPPIGGRGRGQGGLREDPLGRCRVEWGGALERGRRVKGTCRLADARNRKRTQNGRFEQCLLSWRSKEPNSMPVNSAETLKPKSKERMSHQTTRWPCGCFCADLVGFRGCDPYLAGHVRHASYPLQHRLVHEVIFSLAWPAKQLRLR